MGGRLGARARRDGAARLFEFAELQFQLLRFGLPAIATANEIAHLSVERFGSLLLFLGTDFPSITTFTKHRGQLPGRTT